MTCADRAACTNPESPATHRYELTRFGFSNLPVHDQGALPHEYAAKFSWMTEECDELDRCSLVARFCKHLA